MLRNRTALAVGLPLHGRDAVQLVVGPGVEELDPGGRRGVGAAGVRHQRQPALDREASGDQGGLDLRRERRDVFEPRRALTLTVPRHERRDIGRRRCRTVVRDGVVQVRVVGRGVEGREEGPDVLVVAASRRGDTEVCLDPFELARDEILGP